MDSYAESSDGVVLIANGIDDVLRWNGLTSIATKAGVDAPTAAMTVGSSGVGGITGTYYAYQRFVDQFGNKSNLSPISNAATPSGALQIDYTNVPIPQQSTVVTRQILRNTAGQTTTFYVDVETTNLGATSFSSTRVDLDLATQEAVVPATDGTRFGVPPNIKPFLAWHQNRMYLAGVETYREGSCEVAAGSTTVQGRGTEWKSTFAGRIFHTAGGLQTYTISSCDPVAQTLTLTEAYAGATNIYAPYAIKPIPAEANAFQWSEANLPEAWDPLNSLVLPEDSDDVTGIFNYQSFLYFCKRRRLYRLTTRTDPATDGLISLACRRGCINNRCYVNADETLYLLDDGGVYAYRGDDQGQPLSTPIQDYFRQDAKEDVKINWQASRYFHACHSPQEEVIRWYVALAGDYQPRHALCYNYKDNRWWIEKYARRCGSSVLARIGNSAGDFSQTVAQYFVGGSADQIIAPGTVALDGNPVGGTVSGTVTAATTCSLTDSGAVFGSDAIGCPVAIADGKGRYQTRTVVALDGTTRLKLDRPWRILPNTTSTYILGGVPYEYRTQRLRWQPGESDVTMFAEVEYVPSVAGNKGRIEFAPDFSSAPKSRYPIDKGFRPNVDSDVNVIGQTFDLSSPEGFVVIRNDGHRETMNVSATGRVLQLGLTGVAGSQQARFGTIVLNGVVG